MTQPSTFHHQGPKSDVKFELEINDVRTNKKTKLFVDNVVTHHGGQYPVDYALASPNTQYFAYDTAPTTISMNFDRITVAGKITADALQMLSTQIYNTTTAMNNYSNSYTYTGYEDFRPAPPREFNKFINASDLLEQFIKFLGEEGVHKNEIMDMPLNLFVKWLIIQACEQDRVEPDVVLEVPKSIQPRCYGCRQFMEKGTKVPLHNEQCADFFFARKELVAA